MNVANLLYELKLHARISFDDDDAGLVLMLETAARDVAHVAAITLPDNVFDLPLDLQFAIVDQAALTYDQRGPDEGQPGLSIAASRITARYRGVSLGAPETDLTGGA